MKISAVSRVRSNHRHPVWSFYKSAAIFHQKNNYFNVKIEKFSAIFCDRNYHQQSRWALLTKLYWLFSPKNIFKLNGVSCYQNLTPKNLMLSQLSYIKYKKHKSNKKSWKGKNCSLNSKKHKKLNCSQNQKKHKKWIWIKIKYENVFLNCSQNKFEAMSNISQRSIRSVPRNILGQSRSTYIKRTGDGSTGM